ncbi:MAG: DNA topoisomerase VI subunit B, partial [Methanoculleus bourgensis]|nr:DNA topoisomerase VI subunit B [Methanoculleus bourgensis]
IEVNNYTAREVALTLYNLSRDAAEDADPRPDFVDDIGGEYNKVWRCTLGAGEAWQVVYTGAGDGTLDLRGVEDNRKVVVDLDV